MTRFHAIRTVALALPIWCAVVLPAHADDRAIAQGRYLAHHVAMCVQCHTPRAPNGELDESRVFEGAPVPVAPPDFPDFPWAVNAPPIAGLPGFTDEDEIALLTTGKRPSGPSPKPPMPPFRLSREDAAAIVAYLRSLRPRQVR
jgi:mono/diheme cytochrome c family protein